MLARAHSIVTAVVLAALFSLAVFINTPNSLLMYVFLGGTVLSGALILLHRETTLPHQTGFGWLCFYLFMSVSLLWSKAPFFSQVSWLVMSCSVLMLLAGSQTWLRRYSPAIICAQIFTAFLLVLDRFPYVNFKLPFINWQDYDPNGLGALLGLGAFMLLSIIATSTNRRHILLYLGFVFLAVLGLIMTSSRGALLCFILGLMIVGVLNIKHPLLQKHRYGIAGAIGVLMFTAMVLTWERFSQWLTYPLQDISVSGRITQWVATLDMIADRPLAGTGLGTYYLAYPLYRQPGDPSTGFFVHSDPLQFATELGLPGMVLFYACVGFIFYTLAQRYIQSPVSSNQRLALSAMGAALFGMLAQSHITFLFYIPANLMLWSLALGIYSSWFEQPARAFTRVGRAGMTAFLLMVALLAGSIGISRFFIDKGDMITAARYGSPLNPDLYLKGAQKEIDMWRLGGAKPDADEETDILNTLSQAATLNPFSAMPDYLRGQLAELQGQMDTALYFYATGAAKNPRHYQVRDAYMNLLEKRGDWKTLYRQADRALRDPLPYFYLGKFQQYREKASMHLMKGIVEP